MSDRVGVAIRIPGDKGGDPTSSGAISVYGMAAGLQAKKPPAASHAENVTRLSHSTAALSAVC
jgi:hypothetical protein